MSKQKKEKIALAMAYVLSEKFGWEVNKDNRHHCEQCSKLLHDENYCPLCGKEQKEYKIKVDTEALFAAYCAGKKKDKS